MLVYRRNVLVYIRKKLLKRENRAHAPSVHAYVN